MSMPIPVNVKTIDEARQAFQVVEINRRTAPLNNAAAASAPTTTDDYTQGYSPLSLWVVTGGDVYMCTDATKNNAVWLNLSSGGFVGAGYAYKQINCPAGDNVVSVSPADILTLLAGSTKLSITGSNGAVNSDTISFDVVQANIDHGSLSGLTDVADHPSYLLLDGTRAMSGNLDMGNNFITKLALVKGANDNTVLAFTDGAGFTNYIGFENASGTDPPRITCAGQTNLDITIDPNGTGKLNVDSDLAPVTSPLPEPSTGGM